MYSTRRECRTIGTRIRRLWLAALLGLAVAVPAGAGEAGQDLTVAATASGSWFQSCDTRLASNTWFPRQKKSWYWTRINCSIKVPPCASNGTLKA